MSDKTASAGCPHGKKVEFCMQCRIDDDSRRTYTQAELDAALQSATERLPCGHWKGDWVKIKHLVVYTPRIYSDSSSYCRTCAEIQFAKVAAMVAQRDADAETCDAVSDCGECTHTEKGPLDCHAADQQAIRNAPLASAESQKWLEAHDAEIIDRVEQLFIKILRGDLPPMAANNCDAVAEALTHQLTVARAEAYRQGSIEMCPHCRKEIPAEKNSHGFWYHDSEPCEAGKLLNLVAEAEAQAREGEVKSGG